MNEEVFQLKIKLNETEVRLLQSQLVILEYQKNELISYRERGEVDENTRDN